MKFKVMTAMGTVLEEKEAVTIEYLKEFLDLYNKSDPKPDFTVNEVIINFEKNEITVIDDFIIFG